MILLTKLDGKEILINENNIEYAHETPDTVVVMSSGRTYIVSQSLAEITQLVIDYQRVSKRRLRDGMAD